MEAYRVTFFKNVMSSDGHQFCCPQRIIDIRRAKSHERAIWAAHRRCARAAHVRDWRHCADRFEWEQVTGRSGTH